MDTERPESEISSSESVSSSDSIIFIPRKKRTREDPFDFLKAEKSDQITQNKEAKKLKKQNDFEHKEKANENKLRSQEVIKAPNEEKKKNRLKGGRKKETFKTSVGWKNIGRDTCWVQRSQRGNKGLVAIIGRTKYNIVRKRKWKKIKENRKIAINDMPVGTVLGLDCAYSKRGLCNSRKGRIRKPAN